MTVVKKGEPAMAIVVIENSVVNTDNLKILGYDEAWLESELARLGQKLDDVFLAEVHDQKLWVYPDNKDYLS
ncbi:YetF domain-containing protein [Snodgrassella sp. B3882]|uniref:YetF domain-containing protein n=1 Tax=Snodgrassella sp. B3882 TaxID=2818037 RepID=UPI00226A5C9D|nr:YetF domain-containing protein [Snodgrassella sp. B3882]